MNAQRNKSKTIKSRDLRGHQKILRPHYFLIFYRKLALKKISSHAPSCISQIFNICLFFWILAIISAISYFVVKSIRKRMFFFCNYPVFYGYKCQIHLSNRYLKLRPCCWIMYCNSNYRFQVTQFFTVKNHCTDWYRAVLMLTIVNILIYCITSVLLTENCFFYFSACYRGKNDEDGVLHSSVAKRHSAVSSPTMYGSRPLNPGRRRW